MPQDTMYINECTYLRAQATIQINQTDSCLIAKLNGTLHTKYKCDLDGDGIPDVCDDDIDGDGVKNLIGLVMFENKDCSIVTDPTLVQSNPVKVMNVNLDLLKQQYQGVCSLDNASFTPNTNQFDLNQDGIGDAQGTGMMPPVGSGEALDTDGDGIPDITDLCPNINGM